MQLHVVFILIISPHNLIMKYHLKFQTLKANPKFQTLKANRDFQNVRPIHGLVISAGLQGTNDK